MRGGGATYLHGIADGHIGVVADLLELRLEGAFLRLETVGAFVQHAADELQQFLVLLLEDRRLSGQAFVVRGRTKAGVERGEMCVDDLWAAGRDDDASRRQRCTSNRRQSDDADGATRTRDNVP